MRGLRRHRHFWPITVAITTLAVTMATFPAYVTWAQQFHGQTPQDLQERHLPGAAHRRDPGPDHRHAGARPCRRGERAARRARPGPRADPERRAASARGRARGQVRDGRRLLRAAVDDERQVGRPLRHRLRGDAPPIAASAEPFHFQATDLGSYLLWDSDKEFVDPRPCSASSRSPKPGARRPTGP